MQNFRSWRVVLSLVEGPYPPTLVDWRIPWLGVVWYIWQWNIHREWRDLNIPLILRLKVYSWWVVWVPFFIFPYIGNNHPNWLSYFSEGFKPPTSESLFRIVAIIFPDPNLITCKYRCLKISNLPCFTLVSHHFPGFPGWDVPCGKPRGRLREASHAATGRVLGLGDAAAPPWGLGGSAGNQWKSMGDGEFHGKFHG